MEHPLIEEYLERYPEHRENPRKMIAYLAFKEMEQNEDFLRAVADALAERDGYTSSQSKRTYRAHLRTLVDPRYMHPKSIGMILAAHEVHRTRGNVSMVSDGLVKKYASLVPRGRLAKPTWRASVEKARIASFLSGGPAKLHEIAEYDHDLAEGYARYIVEKIPQVAKELKKKGL